MMRCTKPYTTLCLIISVSSSLIHFAAEIQHKLHESWDFNSFRRIFYIDLMITWYQNACLVNNNSSNKTLLMKHDENKIQNICATSNCMHTMCRSVLLCCTTLKRKIQICINRYHIFCRYTLLVEHNSYFSISLPGKISCTKYKVRMVEYSRKYIDLQTIW